MNYEKKCIIAMIVAVVLMLITGFFKPVSMLFGGISIMAVCLFSAKDLIADFRNGTVCFMNILVSLIMVLGMLFGLALSISSLAVAIMS